jgi:glucose/arabinose dehydrogenase
MRTPILAAVCLALAATDVSAQLRARVYAAGFSTPLDFVQDPTDPTVQFVVEQGGRIRVVRNGTVLGPDFIDLTPVVKSGGEQGLLGLAFPPNASATGRFFVNFTDLNGHTVVARFKRSANPLVADPSTRFDLRWNGVNQPALIQQPFANHNGGHLAFGPDGYLYVGMGDGGSGNDPNHFAQSPSSLLGKFLRVDVNVPDTDPIGYAVPADNPFVGTSTRPEIWSFGVRNPWRFSFDDVSRGGTGAMVIGDVGQGQWEEVDYEPRGRGGRNYGWRNREGMHDNVLSLPPAFTPLVDPIHEYDHSTGGSITGGFVYRGAALGSGFAGRYFFADFTSSRVWSMALSLASNGDATASDVREHTVVLGGPGELANVASFGVDSEGELYIVSYSRGVILKVESSLAPPTNLRIIR